MVRAVAVAVLVGAVFVLSGCQYLLGLGGIPPDGSFGPAAIGSFDPGDLGSFDPGEDPDFSMPPPIGTYKTGSATVTMGGTAAALDRLTGPGNVYLDFGTEVGWTDGKGLYVHYFGSSGPGALAGDGLVTIDRIAGGQHWSSADPTLCTVKVAQQDAKALVGTATCKAVRWADTMAGMTGPEPPLVAGEAPFDAEITFRAAP